jgi:hypothetical protein
MEEVTDENHVDEDFISRFINEEIYPVPDDKEIVVLVEYQGEIPENDRQFLDKILTAANVKAHQYKIVNVAGKVFNPAGDTKKILAFGISETALGGYIPFHKATEVESIDILRSYPLRVLEPDAAMKKDLWVHLQKFF